MSYSTQAQELGPAGHNAPCSNRDFDFFYAGLERGQLLVQKCRGCGTLRGLPSPACAECRSLEWDAVPLSGAGVVHSYVIHHHPPLPGFETPHPIAVADMAEGVRMMGAMDGTPAEQIAIGMPIQVEFTRRGPVAAYRFRLA
jgi:uncharacterized OB-fold protein